MWCFARLSTDEELFLWHGWPTKGFSLISSRDHCQRSSPSWISVAPRAGFEPAQNLSSGLVGWICAVEITTAPPLLFLIHVNDLKDGSKSLDCIIFADDTNFFYSHKNIKGLFYTVNSELDLKPSGLKPNLLSQQIIN